MESRALNEASLIPECVVALGGGALLRAENLHQVLQNGTVVYLRLTEQAVIDRLSQISSDTRPLLSGDLSDESDDRMDHEQRGRHVMLLRERLPGYESAHITVDMDGLEEIESLKRLQEAIIRDGFTLGN
jgi:shikimate kinase